MNLDASVVHCFVNNVSFFVNVSLLEILAGYAVSLHSSPSTKELSVRLKLVSKYRSRDIDTLYMNSKGPTCTRVYKALRIATISE